MDDCLDDIDHDGQTISTVHVHWQTIVTDPSTSNLIMDDCIHFKDLESQVMI